MGAPAKKEKPSDEIRMKLGPELGPIVLADWRATLESGIGGTLPTHIKELIARGLSTQPQIDVIQGARKRAFIEAKYAITMAVLELFREQTEICNTQLTEIRAAGKCTNCGHSWLEEQALSEPEIENDPAPEVEAPPEES